MGGLSSRVMTRVVMMEVAVLITQHPPLPLLLLYLFLLSPPPFLLSAAVGFPDDGLFFRDGVTGGVDLREGEGGWGVRGLGRLADGGRQDCELIWVV